MLFLNSHGKDNKKGKSMSTLHIVNGGCTLAYFKKENPELTAIAFEEAMCAGDAALPILGKEFICRRCISLHTSEDEYLQKIVLPLQKIKDYTHIVLWFDEDMFCQINLLTLLAYLQQENIPLPQSYHVIDNSYHTKYEEVLMQANYLYLFEQVVMKKQDMSLDGLLGKGIARYLALNREENELTSYIKAHPQTERNLLMQEMLNRFSCYGLGDIQYLALIDRVRQEQL